MIVLNDVLAGIRGETLYRVVHINTAFDELWLMALDDPLAWPRLFPWHRIMQRFTDGAIKHFDGWKRGLPEAPSAAAQQKRDVLWSLILPIVNDPRSVVPGHRSALVTSRAKEVGCSRQTLYTALRRYWQNGLTPNALLPRYHNCCGKPGETGNRGRKPVMHPYGVYQMTDTEIADIKRFAKRTYAKQETMTLRASYQRYLESNHSYVDETGRRLIKGDGEKPSLRQFVRALKTFISPEEVYRGKYGDKAFERTKRARLGSIGIDGGHIGDYYEIDATIMDVVLVDSVTRKNLIGKATLFLVVDRFSRLIVGFHIGLGAPSWEAAQVAIASIAADKKTLCATYGVPYAVEDWPAHGLYPRNILADRGEMLSTNSNLLIDGLEITVANLPSQRPDHKPVVESRFKLLQANFREGLPGYHPPEQMGKRRTKNYEADACLTLEDATSIVLSNIIAYNRKVMPKYALNPEQLADKVVPSPLAIWSHSLRKHSGALRRFSYDRVSAALMPRGEATVNQHGISFKGLFYTCALARQKRWFTSARDKSFSVEISYNPSTVREIYIHGVTNDDTPVVATLLEKSAAFQKLSFGEYQTLVREHAELLAQVRTHNHQHVSDLHAVTDPKVENAFDEMVRNTRGTSFNARKSDVKQNRRNERELERQRSLDKSNPLYSAEPAPAVPKSNAEVIPIRESPLIAVPSPTPSETPEEKRQRLKKEALNAL